MKPCTHDAYDGDRKQEHHTCQHTVVQIRRFSRTSAVIDKRLINQQQKDKENRRKRKYLQSQHKRFHHFNDGKRK